MKAADDVIEHEYKRAIQLAIARGDNEEAYWLSIGLREYRNHYKVSE